MNLYTRPMLGADPEIFIEDKNGLVPAFQVLSGKDKPIRIDKQYATKCYHDGFAAEFNTTPTACIAWQIDAIQAGLEKILSSARAGNKDVKLSARTVVRVNQLILDEEKEENIQLGCLPSLNIYGLKAKEVHSRKAILRSSGGHIHFGLTINKSGETVKNIVRTLDRVLAVSCVALFGEFDSPLRREFYGLPGEYRLPIHGIEYRVLSNAWIFHPLIANIVFDTGRAILALGQNTVSEVNEFWKTDDDETINCIINSNVDLARSILVRNKDSYLKILSAAYSGYKEKTYEAMFNFILGGMDKGLATPEDIALNWKIPSGWVTHADGDKECMRTSIRYIEAGDKV